MSTFYRDIRTRIASGEISKTKALDMLADVGYVIGENSHPIRVARKRYLAGEQARSLGEDVDAAIEARQAEMDARAADYRKAQDELRSYLTGEPKPERFVMMERSDGSTLAVEYPTAEEAQWALDNSMLVDDLAAEDCEDCYLSGDLPDDAELILSKRADEEDDLADARAELSKGFEAASANSGKVWVKPHTRADGVHVAGHWRKR